MLAEVPANAEEVWCGPDDDDLKQLLRDVQQVHLPNWPRRAWSRLDLLNRIKNYISAIELDHIKILKEIEKGDPYRTDNAADWLANSMHLRPNAAYARVCTACELEKYPGLDSEVHAGNVSPEATTVIVQTLRRVRKHLTPEHVIGMESEMLLAAKEMDPAQDPAPRRQRVGYRASPPLAPRPHPRRHGLDRREAGQPPGSWKCQMTSDGRPPA